MKKIYAILLCILLVSCNSGARLGMIEDPNTGLLYGSKIEKSFFLDAEQFPNKIVKVSARNISGDINYNMKDFVEEIESSFQSKGYQAYENDGFGLKVDIAVHYSGQITSDLSKEFAFLGAGGGLALSGDTARSRIGGVLVGATVGGVLGSFVRDNTYITVANVTIGIFDVKKNKKTKTITFSSSSKRKNDRDEDEDNDSFKRFREVVSTKIAVYAGGRNVSQAQIVDEVRKRLARIVSDML